MNKTRTKIRNLKGDDNPISTNLNNPDNHKYLPKIKESKLRRLLPYHEGLQEYIKWNIQYYNNMWYNHVKWVIRNNNPPSPEDIKAIQISESHFWQLTMALQDTSLSEIIKTYETQGPDGTADGRGADKSIHIAMETEDTNNVLAVALRHQLDNL